MKFAIFSDVHGNLESLEAVLAHAAEQGVAFHLCLGDIIGYGANPNECVDRVRSLPKVVCLKGNHDAAVVDARERVFFHEVALEGIHFSAMRLTPQNADFLRTLPYVYRQHPRVMAVHASPYRPEEWEYVLDQAGAERAFDALPPHRAAFIGHSHSPVVFVDDGTAQRFPNDGPLMLDLRTRRYVINVGSVGQPRDGNPDASYVIFDDETDAARLFRVRYDREKAAEKILKAGLPPVLAERLLVGF
ncbi:MAG TPA: metallophosphoesterase family protein [Candidatus Krumholzibacteria bacterium]|nr:metallophosphoesterase family protein [Candidatus Krumholzibacteria bacterium]